MTEFVDIKNFEGYYKINRLGEVLNVQSGKIKKNQTDKDGYYVVGLYKNKVGRTFKVHRLIARAFIPNPLNKPCIDHINRNNKDNRIENLRWYTIRENAINQKSVENRKGCIQTISRKNGNISYRLRYHLPGNHGKKNVKSKTFKSMEELEIFRKQIYD